MDRLLSLKDFSLSTEENIMERADSFQEFVDQMDGYRHNGYFISSKTNTGSRMTVRMPYTGEYRDVVSFVSNDYLGMSRNAETIAAGVSAVKKYGTGVCAAPIIGGMMDMQRELETALADFVGCEDSLVFSSGFGANEGVLRVLLGKNDIALIDSFIHSSSLNGLIGTNTKNIGHNDLDYLETALKSVKDKYRTKLLIIDGVYSQDGDLSLLPQMIELCHSYGAFVMLDDAHGIGVFGPDGRGVADHYGLLGKVDIVTGTLSKAFGCVGGFAASSRRLVQYLRYYSPQTVFSASPAPQVMASSLKALEIMKSCPEIRERLWSNVRLFRSEMERLGIDTRPSVSQIFPVKIRDNKRVKDLSARLLELGIYAIGICYPAVRDKDARIRISILATHTEEDILRLSSALEAILSGPQA